jgi:tol-pal system protein YbgF
VNRISEENVTMRRMSAAAVLVGALLLAPHGASAASKEQQLLMAELRMMQANQQQLAQSLIALAETLKTVTGRLDEQAATSRKALADQRLLIEGMTDTVRMLREKSDDTNVRLSSITQELESIRQSISALPQPTLGVAPSAGPAADPAGGVPPAGGAPPAPAATAPPPGVSPQRTYDSAFSDYTGGQYDLAIDGFRSFLKYFPRHMNADDAQLNIGNALYNAGKPKEAVTEYQRVISDYPKTDSVPAAYYKLGLTYNQLKQPDLARKQFETVLQSYAGAPEATLAKQALDRLGK